MTDAADQQARPASRLRALLTASATVTTASIAVNLLSYGLLAVGTRRLGPSGYGELAALLGLLLIGAVPATAVQVVVARRVAAGETGGLGRASVRAALAVTLACAGAIPVLRGVLHLPALPVALVAVTLAPMTLAGALMGAVQGQRRFGRLATVITVAGAGRVGGALVGLASGGTATTTMAGMATGAWLALLTAGPVLDGSAWHRLTASRHTSDHPPTREVTHAAVAMLATAAIMTADVLLAQHYLPAVDAGRYGAAAIVTKVAIWLPYAVTMIALPRLAVAGQRPAALRVSVAVLTALGLVEVGGILVLGPWLFPLAVGDGYQEVTGLLWLFAVEGAALAVAQLVIMSRLAATDRWVGPLLWVALAAEVLVAGVLHGSITTIVTIGTVTALAVGTVGAVLPVTRRPTAPPLATPPVAG